MATHSSILAWRIPWTEEPSRLQSIESHRVEYTWNDLPCIHTYLLFNSLLQWILSEHLLSVKFWTQLFEWKAHWYLKNHGELIEGWANCDLGTKFTMACFCQVYWLIYLCIIHGSFCVMMAMLNNHNRVCIAWKSKTFIILLFTVIL